MSLSASSMKSRIEAYMAAVSDVQVSTSGPAVGYRDAMLLALCEGIVDEITSNAVVHTVDSRGDTCNSGTVT
jgi:uncharacterized membrane protein